MSPLCIEEQATSASHRYAPFIWASLLLGAMQTMQGAAINDTEGDEAVPNDDTVRSAMNIVAEIPSRLIGQPDLNPFFGEVHVAWRNKQKQVVLMVFPNRTPLIHHYPATQDAPIEEASAERIANRLRWLHE